MAQNKRMSQKHIGKVTVPQWKNKITEKKKQKTKTAAPRQWKYSHVWWSGKTRRMSLWPNSVKLTKTRIKL